MSGGALYDAIYNDIIERILSRSWAENEPLPAERTLCQDYHVSRTTVRRAFERLEQDSYIIRKHGHGNFVKPQGFKQSLSRFYSFADALKTGGVIIKNNVLHYEMYYADAGSARDLQCEAGECFHKITRLRSARDYPLMLEDTYLPKSRFFRLDIDWLQEHSLYEYLSRHYDLRITRSTELLSPVMPNPEQRTLLNIPHNLPCMAIERFSYEGDVLVEYTTSIVRGDKYKFEAELIV